MVESNFEPLKSRVEAILEMAMTTVDSLSTLFVAPSRESQLVNLDAAGQKSISFDSSPIPAGKQEAADREEKADVDMIDASLR